jgi:hypothetical protein
MNLKIILHEGGDLVQLAVQGQSTEQGDESSRSIKEGKFLDELSDY